MRPRRLELEGFASFRERTVVDFDGADLFAFSGPTGAGKSSLIDAIVFVLYGSVPRYDDQRAVAPIITQGRNEAVLGLEFSVGGDDYVATRVVRRTKGKGATTKEARLERLRPGGDPEVVAGTADEVSAEVEKLLGLGFEHFTRCVVLPQGEFAKFLLDKPKDRQALLMRLLDLGVYEQMGKIARSRGDQLGTEIKVLEGKLEQIGAGSPDLVDEAGRRKDATEELEALLAEVEPKFADFDEARRKAAADADAAAGALRALGAIEKPAGVAALAEMLATKRRLLEDRERAECEAEALLNAAAESLARHRDQGELAKLIADHERRAELTGAIRERAAELAPLAAASTEAAAELAAAEAGVEKATARLRAVENDHLAHTLAGTLATGEPCPVCAQTVTTLPALATPEDVPAAEAALAGARRHSEEARAKERSTAKSRVGAEAALEGLRKQAADLDARLAAAPTADECARQLQRRREQETVVEEAQAGFDAARRAHSGAKQDLDRADKANADARVVFGRARDAVAAWSPPEPGNADLGEDWDTLVSWAGSQLPAHREANIEAEAATRAADDGAGALLAGLSAEAEPLGIRAHDLAGLRTGIPKAAEQAAGAYARAVEDLRQAEELRAGVIVLAADKRVADALGRHLKADGFQTWLQQEAQQQLVGGASKILEELSGDAYSLALDDKATGFDVVDHRNADQARSARTLSGGETFMASLALALALGDHIQSMAAHGAARLESLFLDEGFGTLDPDTLDVVASAIEELGASGRMVGLVTHVRDLAERVPVRFEVSKGAGGSSVERVDT